MWRSHCNKGPPPHAGFEMVEWNYAFSMNLHDRPIVLQYQKIIENVVKTILHNILVSIVKFNPQISHQDNKKYLYTWLWNDQCLLETKKFQENQNF